MADKFISIVDTLLQAHNENLDASSMRMYMLYAEICKYCDFSQIKCFITCYLTSDEIINLNKIAIRRTDVSEEILDFIANKAESPPSYDEII